MRSACGVHLSQHRRSLAEAKGEGQGAHMVKGSGEIAQGGLHCLPLLLGRPESPRGLPDLINHFLSSMRSLRLCVDATVIECYRKTSEGIKTTPPLPPASLVGLPYSHVAAEVMVGGHREIQRNLQRQKWQTTRLCSAAACILLNHKGTSCNLTLRCFRFVPHAPP